MDARLTTCAVSAAGQSVEGRGPPAPGGIAQLLRGHAGIAAAASFALGVLLAWAVPLHAASCCVLLGAPALLAATRGRAAGPARVRTPLRALLWGLLLAAVGALRASSGSSAGAPSPAERAGPVRIHGRIETVPVLGPSGPRGSARELEFLLRSGGGAGEYRVRIAIPRGAAVPSLRAGDEVTLPARVTSRPPPRNPGAPFPFAATRARVRFAHVRSPDAVTLRPRRSGTPAGRLLLSLRQEVHELIHRLYGPRARGLVLSMLIGDRRLLPDELRESFISSGTFHFLAISGLHVGIVLLIVLRLPLPRGARSPARLLFLAGFALVTGAHPPVVRAALMCGLHILLGLLGRRPRPLNTLGWTALVLLANEPRVLAEIGFQLSFAAVAAIIIWARELDGSASRLEIEKVLPRRGRRAAFPAASGVLRWVRLSLAVSLASTVATAPLLLYYFQRVHPLSPIWTLAAYPLVVLILLGALASVVIGSVHPAPGSLAALPVEAAIDVLAWILEQAAAVPGSRIDVPRPPLWRVLLAYALMALSWSARTRRAGILLGVVVLAVLLVPGGSGPEVPRLVHFDAGAASAALLELPDGSAFLIDAGVSAGSSPRHLLSAVLALGRRRIAGVFLTHPDSDHVGAVEELAARLSIERVWVSSLFARAPRGAGLIARLERQGIPCETLARGDIVRVPGEPPLAFEVLYPQEAEALPLARRTNDASLSLAVALGSHRVLCLGDLEEDGLARLLSAGDDLNAEVLILPHHGRRNARYPELLAAVRPRAVVISGDGSGGGHETEEELTRAGYEVWTTWKGGAIVQRLEPDGWKTEYWARGSGG